jgi:prophage maintenance system killer protein
LLILTNTAPLHTANPLWRGRQSGYYADLVQEAAALWESLFQNHPFVDGNKRVAVAVTAASLRVNGYRLDFKDGFA